MLKVASKLKKIHYVFRHYISYFDSMKFKFTYKIEYLSTSHYYMVGHKITTNVIMLTTNNYNVNNT